MQLEPLPLAADRGLVFYAQIAFFGVDFTGSAYRMQVRKVPDDGGDLYADLATTTSSTAQGIRLVYAGSDTLPNHVAADRISQEQADAAKLANGYTDADSVPLSVLNARIVAATMDSMPFPEEIGEGERGDNVQLAYDLLVTLPGGDATKYAYGPFTVRGTVTQ